MMMPTTPTKTARTIATTTPEYIFCGEGCIGGAGDGDKDKEVDSDNVDDPSPMRAIGVSVGDTLSKMATVGAKDL